MIEEFIKVLRNPKNYENGVLKISEELALMIADELEKVVRVGD